MNKILNYLLLLFFLFSCETSENAAVKSPKSCPLEAAEIAAVALLELVVSEVISQSKSELGGATAADFSTFCGKINFIIKGTRENNK